GAQGARGKTEGAFFERAGGRFGTAVPLLEDGVAGRHETDATSERREARHHCRRGRVPDGSRELLVGVEIQEPDSRHRHCESSSTKAGENPARTRPSRSSGSPRITIGERGGGKCRT